MEKLLGTTFNNSSFQELSLGSGRRQSGVWAHWYFKIKIVFHLENAFSFTLSHVHTLTLPPNTHMYTPSCLTCT